MYQKVGMYLPDNNYYCGAIDKERNLIWVSIEGSDDFTEFKIERTPEGKLYFLHENYKVEVEI